MPKEPSGGGGGCIHWTPVALCCGLDQLELIGWKGTGANLSDIHSRTGGVRIFFGKRQLWERYKDFLSYVWRSLDPNLEGIFFFKVLSLFFIFIWRDYELKTFFKIFLSFFLTSSKSWILGVLVFIFTILDLNVIVTPQIQSFCKTKERAGAQTRKPNFFFFCKLLDYLWFPLPLSMESLKSQRGPWLNSMVLSCGRNNRCIPWI